MPLKNIGLINFFLQSLLSAHKPRPGDCVNMGAKRRMLDDSIACHVHRTRQAAFMKQGPQAVADGLVSTAIKHNIQIGVRSLLPLRTGTEHRNLFNMVLRCQQNLLDKRTLGIIQAEDITHGLLSASMRRASKNSCNSAKAVR